MYQCYLLPVSYKSDGAYDFELEGQPYVYYDLSEFEHVSEDVFASCSVQNTRHEGVYVVTDGIAPAEQFIEMLHPSPNAAPAQENEQNDIRIVVQSWRDGIDREPVFAIVRKVFGNVITEPHDYILIESNRRPVYSMPCRSQSWCIKLWATPTRNASTITNEAGLFGRTTRAFTREFFIYTPSTNSKPIMLDGIVVGQLIGRSVYAHYDAIRGSNVYDVLELFLLEALAVANGKEYDQTEVFLSRLENLALGRIGNVRGDLERLEDSIASAINDLTAWYRRRSELMATIEAFKAGELGERLRREIELVKANKRIKSVEVQGESFIFMTEYLHFSVDEKKYELGEFRVSVNINNGSVNFSNQTRRVDSGYEDGMHAPHVFASGSPCFGNVQSSVAQLLAELEFAAMADVLCSFLESVNITDAAGKYYYNWPEVTE